MLANVYVAVTIVAGIVALVLLWFVSKKAPRGTTLVIACLLYGASWFWFINSRDSADFGLATGILRSIGVIAVILGVSDLFRKRPKDRPGGEEGAEPAPDSPPSAEP